MAGFYHGIVALLVIFFCLVNLSHQQAGECRTFPSCCSLNSSTSCGTETPCPGGRLTCDPTGACCCIKFDSKYTHLTAGAAKPPLVPGKVRVYHTRCCPTTHGVMLVAKAKNISMDVVYINLDNRPEWLENELGGVESHPVPIIELENGTLIRSMILNSEFLDNTFPVQGELCPKDLSKKINDRVLIDEFDTVMAQLFRDIVFGIGLKSPEKVPALIKEFEFGVMRLGEELDRRGTKFFGGNEKPGMVDFMIWPWFERKPIYKLYYPSAYDYEQTSARMTAWADDMKEVPAVKSLGLGIQVYYEFYSGFRTGNRDFNMLSG